jgi:hypothetical protein
VPEQCDTGQPGQATATDQFHATPTRSAKSPVDSPPAPAAGRESRTGRLVTAVVELLA